MDSPQLQHVNLFCTWSRFLENVYRVCALLLCANDLLICATDCNGAARTTSKTNKQKKKISRKKRIKSMQVKAQN